MVTVGYGWVGSHPFLSYSSNLTSERRLFCSECYYQAAANIKLSAGTRGRVMGKEDRRISEVRFQQFPQAPRTLPGLGGLPGRGAALHPETRTMPDTPGWPLTLSPLSALTTPPIRVFYTLLGRPIKDFKDGPKQSLHYGPPLPLANGNPESAYEKVICHPRAWAVILSGHSN